MKLTSLRNFFEKRGQLQKQESQHIDDGLVVSRCPVTRTTKYIRALLDTNITSNEQPDLVREEVFELSKIFIKIITQEFIDSEFFKNGTIPRFVDNRLDGAYHPEFFKYRIDSGNISDPEQFVYNALKYYFEYLILSCFSKSSENQQAEVIRYRDLFTKYKPISEIDTPERHITSGFNTALDSTFGLFIMIPEVFKTCFHRSITPEEYLQIIRNFERTIHLISRFNIVELSALFALTSQRQEGIKREFNPNQFEITRDRDNNLIMEIKEGVLNEMLPKMDFVRSSIDCAMHNAVNMDRKGCPASGMAVKHINDYVIRVMQNYLI